MRWSRESLLNPVFDNGDAVYFANGAREAVRTWAKRGFINPKPGKYGKKNIRLYSAADLLQIFTATGLLMQHTSVHAAFLAGSRIVDRLMEILDGSKFPHLPADEYWLFFEDSDDTTQEYIQNSRVNFHLVKSYSKKGYIGPPSVGGMQHSLFFEVKTEYFNADQIVKKFLALFHKAKFDETYMERALDIFPSDPLNSKIDKEIAKLLSEFEAPKMSFPRNFYL